MFLGPPIHRKFLLKRKTGIVTQLMGENKNKLFYGPDGHQGIDLRTRGTSTWDAVGRRHDRTPLEKAGFIWLVAMIPGKVTCNVFVRDKEKGWGIFVTTDWIDGVQYKTMQWHIESPWSTLKTYTFLSSAKALLKRMQANIRRRKVARGAIIAMAGNSGFPIFSNGPHVHVEFYKREKGTPWMRLDPIKHFRDNIIYRRLGPKIIDYLNGVRL